MSSSDETIEKKDPIKIHREGTALADAGKHKEAIDKFLEAYELYEKARNLFDASYTLFKAAECSFITKDFNTAVERFLKAADISLEIGYDRFGLSALEYSLDCYKALKDKKMVVKLKKQIKEVKDKLSTI